MSSVTAQQIHQTLVKLLSPLQLEVLDESAEHMGHAGSDGSGHGTHFRVRITLAAHADARPVSRVARHSLVYDALHFEMGHGIHALAIESFEAAGAI